MGSKAIFTPKAVKKIQSLLAEMQYASLLTTMKVQTSNIFQQKVFWALTVRIWFVVNPKEKYSVSHLYENIEF